MLSLKPVDEPADTTAFERDPSATAEETQTSAPGKGRRLWPTLISRPVVGLDIGTCMIKAVVLKRRKGGIAVSRVAYTGTPREALTNGELTDSIIISDRLRSLFSDYSIRTRRVALATGGERTLCQTEKLGWTSQEERLALIEQSAASTIPYPIAGAAIAFEEFEPSGEQDGLLFWASAPVDRVDWLRETVVLAGRLPTIVDNEACALANAVLYNYEPDPGSASLLLHVGARHIVVGLLRGNRLDFARNTRIARQRPGGRPIAPLADRVILSLEQFSDTLSQRAKPLHLKQAYLSGGPTEIMQIGDLLHSRLGLLVTKVDPFRRIAHPSEPEFVELIEDAASTFTVAVGLALRAFEEL